MDIISKQEAKRLGLTRYFTGGPCSRGHVDERYVSRGVCVRCKREDAKRHYVKNADRIKEKSRKYYADNTEAALERSKEYARRNKDKINSYYKRWREENPGAKIAGNMRVRIREVISRGSRSESTMKMIGCSISELEAHLSGQFTEGMTWDNYGEWHVDHIRPCASFDLSDPSQQKECFHYTNLQPLWAEDNLRKGAKYDAYRSN